MIEVLQHTPVENHDGWLIKREDLFFNPPLSKVRGLIQVMNALKSQGVGLVGTWDTRVSKNGWAVAKLGKELGMKVIVGFPRTRKCSESISTHQAKELGAEIFIPKIIGCTNPMFLFCKRYVELQGGIMLPLGLTFPETMIEVSKELIYTLENQLKDKNILHVVCSVGSGTIFSGLLLGLKNYPNIKLTGISCGMRASRQIKRVRELLKENYLSLCNQAQIIESPYDYYEECNITTSFPCNPWYDKKAYEWLTKNVTDKEHTLFWNIGA